jgi:hypothetical protein
MNLLGSRESLSPRGELHHQVVESRNDTRSFEFNATHDQHPAAT